ncbi:hypothetical protein SBBP1_750021 [Burkholderiales bacterium]|nr:hypothetical protein SBBP1_750021 [Burkholderiales bacterium]
MLFVCRDAANILWKFPARNGLCRRHRGASAAGGAVVHQ